MSKKLVVLLITVSIMISSVSMVTYAEQTTTSDSILNNSAYYQNAMKEMVESGVSTDQAKSILKVQIISKEMDANSETIYMQDGTAKINSKNATSNISQSDRDFIVNTVNQASKVKHVKREDKIKSLEKEMQDNPGRSMYRIDYDDGSFVQMKSLTERVDIIKSDAVNVYYNFPNNYPNEINDNVKYIYSDQTYAHTFEFLEASGVYYSKNMVTVNYTESNGCTHNHINSYYGGQAAYGAFLIANAATSLNNADCDINNPLWTEVVNQVVFSCSGSVGVTLAGWYSVSVTMGASWTQYAITRNGYNCQADFVGLYQ